MNALTGGLMGKARRRQQSAGSNIVRAPDIRVGRGEVELEERSLTDERGRVVGRSRGDIVRDQLWRHHRRGEIKARHYEAGNQFQATAERSTVSIPSLLDFSRVGGGGRDIATLNIGFAAATAASQLHEAMRVVGPVLMPIIIWVVMQGRSACEWAKDVGKPEKDGIAALRLALDALADHYGLE